MAPIALAGNVLETLKDIPKKKKKKKNKNRRCTNGGATAIIAVLSRHTTSFQRL